MGPGSWNVATEDLVYLFNESGINTGISLDAIIGAAEFATELTGQELAGHGVRARAAFQGGEFPEVSRAF